MSYISTIAKSVTGGVAAFGAGFATAWTDQIVSQGEWVAIAVATVVAAVAVWAVPNADA